MDGAAQFSSDLEPRREVSQEWWFVGNRQALDLVALAPDFEDDFDDVVNVALRVRSARDGEAHEVHLGGFAEHQRADLDGAYATFEIKLVGERDAGELLERDV